MSFNACATPSGSFVANGGGPRRETARKVGTDRPNKRRGRKSWKSKDPARSHAARGSRHVPHFFVVLRVGRRDHSPSGTPVHLGHAYSLRPPLIAPARCGRVQLCVSPNRRHQAWRQLAVGANEKCAGERSTRSKGVTPFSLLFSFIILRARFDPWTSSSLSVSYDCRGRLAFSRINPASRRSTFPSHHVIKVERELGVTLIKRSSRRSRSPNPVKYC